nr:bifunctional diaminohydroxyphosphoribosylaminopyrimidine deaminase/5-amino-6-(5-phosphoribosylamino)uracil reductase RibD [Actinomycetes bacterium]
PNPTATGGVARLRAAGVQVESVQSEQVLDLNAHWTYAMQNERPYIIWKVASTLDGRVAAQDGSSRWITGPQAREQSHELRRAVDAVIVGTGTVFTDDPTLTARSTSGPDPTAQPLRVVVGHRAVPASARVRQAAPQDRFVHLATRDLVAVNEALLSRDVHYALLEGGPELAAAYVRAGLLAEVRWYVAPKLLGSGVAAVAGIGIDTIAQAPEWQVLGATRVGEDVRMDLRPVGIPGQERK